MSDYKIETKCIQSGYEPGNGEARVLPIYQSTTFKYSSSEQMGRLFDLEESGYFYTRLQNPTNDAVAAKICDMEGGAAAMLTSSGQAANFYAVMNIAKAGDHIVCASALYGGTYNLYAHTIRKMGVEATFVDPDCTEEELNAAFQENTKAVFGESIANPALVVLDFEKFARLAIPLPNTWTDMHPAWAAPSWTAVISAGRLMQISSRSLQARMRHITESYIPSVLGRALISRRQRRS